MTRIASALPKPLAQLAAFVTTARASQTLRLWTARRRSRRHLADLAPHHLRDIGLDAMSAEAEAKRAFWQ
ncbi:MAG: DUF1127 domain-containing protein [Rhodobacteraceae bacterium]|nr:DUF1127 domain-containing protein [Paracoccaceae bacterium]